MSVAAKPATAETDDASTHRDRARLLGVGTTINGEQPERPDKRNGERTRETAARDATRGPVVPLNAEPLQGMSARQDVILSGYDPGVTFAVSLIRPFRCRFRSNRRTDPSNLLGREAS